MEFSVLMKITHVTQSPYLFNGRIKAGHHLPWERWNSQCLDCIHPCHCFWGLHVQNRGHLFGWSKYVWWIFSGRLLLYYLLPGECFVAECWVSSISALSQKGVFSLLSVIGCRTKSYDSNKNWGCHWHPACHLCWPKSPGASSESSRGRGGLEVDASKLICTHYKQQGG